MKKNDKTKEELSRELKALKKENAALKAVYKKDISERKRAEEEISDAEERFKMVFENFFDGISIYSEDPDPKKRRLIECNERYAAMSGRSREELLKLGNTAGLQITLQDNANDNRLKSLERGIAYRGSFSWIRPDGKENVIEYVGMQITQRGKSFSIGLDRDITERKKIEGAIEKERSLLRTLIDHLPSAVFVKDENYRKVLVNPLHSESVAQQRIWSGMEPMNEILGKTDFEVYPKEMAESYFQDDQKVIRDGMTILNKEELGINPRGEIHWTLITKIPMKDKDGSIKGMVGITTDITNQKLAEEALQKSRELLANITSSIDDAIYSIDGPSGEFIYISPAFERIFGYSLSDIKNMGGRWAFLSEVIQDPDRPSNDPITYDLQREIVKNTPVWEHWWRCKDGSLKYIEDSSVPTYIGEKLIRIDGVLRDITSRKKTELDLLLSEQKFRSVFENSTAGVSLMGLDGRYIMVNPAFCEIFGYSAQELLRLDFLAITHPEDIELSRNSMRETLANKGKVTKYTKRYLHKDGRTIWAEISSVLIYGHSNEPLYFISHITDITERKIVEEENIRAKERAEEMNRLKSNFLANMSHELRTPLVGLLGFSELLESELSGDSKDYAEMINASGMRLLKTLNEILDYSEIEAKKTEVSINSLLINGLLREEIKLYQPLAQQKGLYIEEDFCEDLFILTDIKLLRRIMDNLFNNAVKFTRSGGITIFLRYDAKNAIIKVSDTGIGITEKNINLIFEEFRQVSEGLSRNFDGTGLGLTLVRRYVEMLNGKISVSSVLGKGSEFIISLPLIRPISGQSTIEPESPKRGVQVPAPRTKSLALPDVLLVEDEELNAMVIRKMLEGQFNIVHVSNAKDAIDAAKQNSFHLVLMDINLKHGMSGLDAVKEIRKLDGYLTTPIVAMTAYAMQKDKEEFLNAGCTHYLAKPFARKELIQLLTEIM